MKKLALPLAATAAVLTLWALPAAASSDQVVRTLNKQYSVEGMKGISLDFPVGELKVDAAAGRQVQIRVEIKCRPGRDSCEDAARDIEVKAKSSGGKLSLGLDGWPHGGHGMNARVQVTLPKDLPLKSELGVGEMTINGMEADLDVDLGVGEVHVNLPEAAVRSVDLDTGVGESQLFAQGKTWESSGLVSRELHWNKGAGKASVQVDCGVGEAHVDLR
jgi:hypothetical protein